MQFYLNALRATELLPNKLCAPPTTHSGHVGSIYIDEVFEIHISQLNILRRPMFGPLQGKVKLGEH